MTTTTTRLRRAGIALAAALTLTGCAAGGSDATPDPGPSASADAGAAQVDDADRAFVQMMRPHHEQAVEMSEALLDADGIRPEVAALAEEIRDAQEPEIAQLAAWADAWGVEETDEMDHGDDHGMAGMMSDADMDALDEADGAEAERLFLTQMIAHHTGAIDMAETEIRDGRHPDAVALAEDIVATQEDEVSRMRDLVAS